MSTRVRAARNPHTGAYRLVDEDGAWLYGVDMEEAGPLDGKGAIYLKIKVQLQKEPENRHGRKQI